MMQPPVEPPRDHLTTSIITDILHQPSLRIVNYGLEEVDINGDVIIDHTNRLVGGEVSRDCYAKIHGGCSLSLREGITFEQARVRPSITLTDGTNEATFYLGVYVLEVPELDIASVPQTYDVTGYDLLVVVNDLVGSSYRVSSGTNVVTAVETILDNLGETNYFIESTTETLPNDRIWPLDDTTTWLDIINDLFDSIGYRDLWVDWVGKFRSSPFTEPTDRAAEFTYADDPATTIIAQERSLTPDYFRAPNRWVFIRDDVRSGRFTLGNSGVYEVNNVGEGATSQTSRGRIITKVEYIKAISAASLQRAGNKVVEKDKHIDITIDADVRLNPLHWHFDVVTWSDAALGTTHKALVHEWSFPIMEGPNMSLLLRKV